MGIFYVHGRLRHQRQRKLQRKVRFLVDTGAFFSVAPREILSELKTSPIREETVRLPMAERHGGKSEKSDWKWMAVRSPLWCFWARRGRNRCLGRTALKA